MNKYQKETVKLSLEEEKKVLNSLTSEYKEAKKLVKKKIEKLMSRDDAELPHVIHQVQYQKALESQLDEALSKLKKGEYKTIADYMEDSYGTGFTSSLYRLQKQGVPLLFPMDKNEIIRAVQTNSKISGGLYKRLGINTRAMKNAIRQEITRGISSSMSYGDIARNIDNRMNSGLYNSYRIARTEGHRINQEASFDAMNKAKDAGADIVKQWDSTLDGRTRPHHRELNGQIRELDDPFEIAGLQAMHPSGFGKASEDINCRCVVLEIGRWELDEEDTYTKFNGDENVIVSDLSNVKNYEEFRKKYNIEVKKKETEVKKNEAEEIRNSLFEAFKNKAKGNSYSEIMGNYSSLKDFIDGDDLIELNKIVEDIEKTITEETRVSESKNFDSLSAILSKKYKIGMNASVTKLNFDLVKQSVESVEVIIDEFPDFKKYLKTIETGSTGVMACTGTKIIFNPSYFSDSTTLLESCKKHSASGFWIKNASPKSIGVHESAHGIEWVLIQKNSDYADLSSKIEAWNNCTEAQSIVSEACKNIKKTPYGKGKVNSVLKETISRYATTTPSETMAEAFADVYENGNEANPLSIEIKRLTIERYKSYK